MYRLISIVLLTLLPTLAFAQDNAEAAVSDEPTKTPNSFVLVETTMGDVYIELFDSGAPETVKNFLSYVDDGFYEGTIFHRVIPNFMIQAGGFSKELSKKKAKKSIKNEASEALKNLRGTVAMARTSSPNSATSQFFINTKDNPSLDYRSWNKGYAVFGKIHPNSQRVIDTISFVPTGNIGIYRDVPDESIVITKVTRITAEQLPAESEQKSYFEENYSSEAEVQPYDDSQQYDIVEEPVENETGADIETPATGEAAVETEVQTEVQTDTETPTSVEATVEAEVLQSETSETETAE